jgi:hypothetical protein
LKTRLQINISESFAGKPRDCVEGCGIYKALAEKEKHEKSVITSGY